MTRSFEEIAIGDTAEVLHTITREDIQIFTELTGDDNRLHVDEEFATGTQFGRTIAHGMLGAGFISTLIGTKLPGDGALWHRQTLDFLHPVYEGDTISVRATVVKKDRRNRGLTLAVDVLNQHRSSVLRGEAQVRMLAHKEAKYDGTEHKGGVLVIGGSGGIGRATCEGLAKRGFGVAVHYFRGKEAASVVRETVENWQQQAVMVSGDVRREAEAADIVRLAAQRLDVPLKGFVIAATGHIASMAFNDIRWEDLQQAVEMEVRAAYNVLKAAVPVMEANGGGSVVLLSSQAVDTPNPEWLAYITAKSALEGFARSMAVTLAPKRIRVNIVAPGMTDTALIANLPALAKMKAETAAPLKRLADAGDVASAICFLLSPESSYITGETLRVNGGQVMR